MAVFPAINSNGIRAHHPNGVTFEHLTSATNLASGSHIAWPWRNEPLARYLLTYKSLTDAEVDVLESFFNSMQGRFGQFIYVDPTGNMLQNSEDFTQSSWTRACTVVGSTTDPFGGSTATILAGDGSGSSSISQVVSIDPGVYGSLSCFSVYLKAVSAAGAFNISVTDGATTVDQPCQLSLTAWTRVSVPWTFGPSGMAIVTVGGSVWTGTNQIAVYGPMFSMTPGPASYLKTPGFYAIRPRCRFDQDTFDRTYQAKNQNDVVLRVAEYPLGPGSVGMIVDLSGSIAITGSLANEKQAAQLFVDDLPLSWSVGLWSFSGAAITQRQAYTLDRTAMTSAIAALSSPDDGTPLYDSLVLVSATGPSSILAITDGADSGVYTHTQAEAITACQNAGVSVFIAAFGDDSSLDRAAITAITSQTGGAFAIAPTALQLQALMIQIANQL